MYYAYVLRNSEGSFYIGSCSNLETRLRRHNQNSVRSTKNKGPYELVYSRNFATNTEARKFEKLLKNYKGNAKFKGIIETESPSSSLV